MAELVLLGTAAALPAADQENTYMVLVGRDHSVMIDCAGSPYSRMLLAGLDPRALDTIILTHAHPDHTYGLPSLVMSLWLAGRSAPLHIYGPADACGLARSMLGLYHSDEWPNMYNVVFHEVPLVAGTLFFESSNFRVEGAPVQHLLPTFGLRVTDRESGRAVAYSSDTEPAAALAALAQGAALLLHEAAGGHVGHSSATQAGAVAQAAGVGRLLIVHYDGGQARQDALYAEARLQFAGEVIVARDLDRFAW